jgi:hypothetical protein
LSGKYSGGGLSERREAGEKGLGFGRFNGEAFISWMMKS